MKEISLQLYEKLYRTRQVEKRIIDLYLENEMKTPMHMSMGQEAISAAVAQAIYGNGDIIATYRSHAPFLSITGDVNTFFYEMYGRECGFAEGKSGSMHLSLPEKSHLYSTAIVAGGLPIALGVAFSYKQLGNGRTVAVFFGDGAVEEGAFWESINIASVMRLPVFFICEDNGLAVHARQHIRHGFSSLESVIRCFNNCNFFFDDSNDVESLHDKCIAAINHCNSGKGPAFLHVKCFRYLEHVGINKDFHYGYRTIDEFEPWLKRDCVMLQRTRLIDRGLENQIIEFEFFCDTEIEQAIAQAKEAPLPKPERLWAGVFYENN